MEGKEAEFVLLYKRFIKNIVNKLVVSVIEEFYDVLELSILGDIFIIEICKMNLYIFKVLVENMFILCLC